MMWDRGYGMMGGYGWIGGLITLFFWVVVAVAVVLIVMYLVRQSGGHQGAHHGAGGGSGQYSQGAYVSPQDQRREEERRRYEEERRRYDEEQQRYLQYQREAKPAQPGQYQPQTRQDEAIEIARRRFAAGEITRDEYDDIMRTLAGTA